LLKIKNEFLQGFQNLVGLAADALKYLKGFGNLAGKAMC